MDKDVEAFIARAKAEGAGFVQPRFVGLPTFMRTLHVADWSGVEIGLIGVPFDLGVTNRPGARHGPREIRNQSSLIGFRNHQSRIMPFDLCRVADLGDVALENQFSLDPAIAEIEGFYRRIVAAGVAPLSAGGDHSITYPIMKAIGAARPVGMVHIDAHCDTGPGRGGAKFHHGGPFLHAVEAGVLDPERTVQIGIRGFAEHLWDFSYESGMRVIHMEEFHEMGLKAVIAEARRVVGDGPVYVSFDVDGLDPVYAPGTGTPEIGGLATWQVQGILRRLGALDFRGADVVEVAPAYDVAEITALAAATIGWEYLSLLAAKG